MEDPRPLGQMLDDWTPATVPPRDLVLSGRLVRAEPLTPAHATDLFAQWQGHDWLWDYMPVGPFADADAYGAWIASVQGDPAVLFLALCDVQTGRALGVASYLNIVPGNGSIEVGNICFSPALQGSPAATEAMVLMMGWAFANGYRRYEWKCNALNLPSRRAAQRLGFGYEGVFVRHMVVKGRNRDTAWFAIPDDRWGPLKAAYDRWLSPANFDEEGRQITRLSALTAPLRAADPALDLD
ncbi:GNAT family N-acetyltransferase [Pseudooceanicola sp. CBS1P-1]|uniref:GNAT family N-acetyltransferase n=1 Tax=Pseudooceanicola albus TaxID=2692189 RepID=A0A6L7G2E1_9RHOB|nr:MULTISPECIES: GNAT family protein [Pseudooceanicola]MBT9384926.1 GNAT family N-acetyltransferase [Pseudooceanicola endophyticus]MXN18079.1 GNAT family N-acetyltransferase [Pseudooceanicola albus]